MTWNRDKWVDTYNSTHTHAVRGAELPDEEKETYVLDVVHAFDEPVTQQKIKHHAFAHGPHLAHALWLEDFLKAHPAVRVEPNRYGSYDYAWDDEYDRYEARD